MTGLRHESARSLDALGPRAVAIRKRGGRKLVVTPNGKTERPRPRIDNALIKALARALCWQRMLDNGECGSIAELATAEKLDRS